MQIRNVDSRMLLIAVLAIAVLSQFSFSQPKGNSASATQSADPQRTLIVCLSRTGNTQAVAQIIQQLVGGHLVQLELATPYPDDYRTIVTQVDRENETGYLPPLKTRIENLQAYDTVFVGFPTWDMQLPPPMKSFLKEYDLSGKTVVPFNTNGGYGLGSSIQQIEKLCPESRILGASSTKGGWNETASTLRSSTGDGTKFAERWPVG